MRPILLIFCLIITSCLSGFCASANKPKIIRTWKSADGRELKAELLDFDAVEIKIKRMTDFQIMKVPVAKFSAEDQAFVAALVHERNLDQGMTEGPYAEKITGTFVKAVSKQGLNYQIFGDPKWDGTKRYPMVIWLHGSGQSGSDNQVAHCHQDGGVAMVGLAAAQPAHQPGIADSEDQQGQQDDYDD